MRRQKLQFLGHLERSKGLGKVVPGRKDTWEERKKKVKNAMGKRYSGRFQ